MGYRTNPDRILENIDRQRDRDAGEGPRDVVRRASGKDLDTSPPGDSATGQERVTRILQAIEQAYMKAAQSGDIRKIASRFQSIGDIHHHHARGDVTVTVSYLDADREDDLVVVPYELLPKAVEDARDETKTTRPDVNALKALRAQLRESVLGAIERLDSRVREAIREDADRGHVSAQVTLDIRPAK